MKNLIIILLLITSSVSYSQKFYTVDAEVVPSSLYAYTRKVADTVVVDSTRFQINCWFGQVGNPYIKGREWCQFNQITVTVKGNVRTSQILNQALKLAEAYRKKMYPDKI